MKRTALLIAVLLIAGAPGTTLADDPPKIDWKTFLEQLDQSDGKDVDVGEHMC